MHFTFDGVMLVSELLDEKDIELEDIAENQKIAREMTGSNRYVSLVIAAPYTSISHEARKAAGEHSNYPNTIAQAIVVKNLATRIMGNFFLRFHHPPCPSKLFNDRSAAIEWLHSFLDQNGKTGASNGTVMMQ